MDNSLADRKNVAIACLAYLGMFAGTMLFAWLLGMEGPLLSQLAPEQDLFLLMGRGLLASFPMLACFVLMLRTRWRPLARLRRQVRTLLGDSVKEAKIGALALVAFAAGIGEEALFRGLLQPLFTMGLQPLGASIAAWGGVILAALVFGLAHPMSYAYATVATIFGIYLGAIVLVNGELLSAIIAHGLYDLTALVWLRESLRCRSRSAE